MAARSRKGTKTSGWPIEVRQRIQTSMLINRLTDHAVGKVDLQPTQVRAIEILLKKTMPDLTQVDGSMNVTREPEQMTDAELADIAAGRSPFVAQEESSEDGADSIH